MTVETDRHQNPIKRTYTDALGNQSVVATAEYDEMRRLKKSIDNVANKCYTYTYDEVSNVTEEYIDGVLFKDYEYDNDNRLVKTTVNAGGATQAYLPIYDKTSDGKIYCDNAVVGVELEGVFTHKAEHDEYGRTTEKNLTLANGATPLLSDEYTYLGSATRLTHMVASVTQKLNGVTQGTFGYTYDNNGNITEIRKNNSLIAKYTYDEMNQLVREDNYLLNKTYIFTYDTAGNILSKKTHNTVLATESGTPDATTAYTYATSGWKDQLISVGGEAIVYDVLGNPTTYRGHSLTWSKLRQLNSFDNNTFTYNAKGIRTSKNSITYTLDGTKILSETRPTSTIKYLYGASGVIGFTYNGNTYYYEKNIQGDVTAIVNASGTIKAKYVYDAWGNHTITLNTDGIGTLNPIRYRSYYFDTETGLYYLQSRYYDPAVGRFINADDIFYLGIGNLISYNLFSYCSNNPTMRYDPLGHFFGLAAAIIVTGAIVGGILGAYSAAATGGNILESAIEGCLTGALGSACGILIANPIVAVIVAGSGGVAIDIATQATSQYVKTGEMDMSEIDYKRAAKIGIQTGLGAAIPQVREGAGNAVDAVETAVLWAEGATIITCADVIITNTMETSTEAIPVATTYVDPTQTSNTNIHTTTTSKSTSKARGSRTINNQQMLLR